MLAVGGGRGQRRLGPSVYRAQRGSAGFPIGKVQLPKQCRLTLYARSGIKSSTRSVLEGTFPIRNTDPGRRVNLLPLDDAASLGAACREARRRLGLRLDEAALVAGVNYRFASELENGKYTARLGLALRYATSLGVRLFLALPEPAEGAAPRGPQP